MKKLLTLLLAFASLSINGQAIKGYVTSKITYNYEDSTYNTNNVSGIILSFQKIFSDSITDEYLKIGEVTQHGTIYSNYKIVEKKYGPAEDPYVVYGTMNLFGDKLVFKYYLEQEKSFTLVFEHNQCSHNKDGIFQSFYTGLFLK